MNYGGARVRLHKLWDAKIIEVKEQGSSAEIAARFDEGVTPDDRQAWERGTVAEWAEGERQQAEGSRSQTTDYGTTDNQEAESKAHRDKRKANKERDRISEQRARGIARKGVWDTCRTVLTAS